MSDRSPRSASSWRSQLRSVCSEQPNSAASCDVDRAPLRNKPTASRRNSAGYGGLVLDMSAPLPGHRPKASRCQPDRVNSNLSRGGGGSSTAPPFQGWGFDSGHALNAAPIPHIRRGRTIVLRVHDTTATYVDNAPANISQGDEIAVEGLLRRAGHPGGHLEAHEVLTGLNQSGGGRLELVFTALLSDGQVTSVAVLGLSQSGASNGKAAIVGGTGRYRNVRGEVYIHPDGATTLLTYLLLP
jgi:hypothetical protein